jgi:type IV pilus assembly protein PilX
MNTQSQRGAVLLVSLVLLLLLTTIAITASNQATLQQRMAANSQQQNSAFQAAESGLQAWAKEFKVAPLSFTSTPQDWSTGAGQAKYNATAGIANNCTGVIPAFSLNADETGMTFKYACYEIQSTGQSCPDANCNAADNPATATHIQGYLVRY